MSDIVKIKPPCAICEREKAKEGYTECPMCYAVALGVATIAREWGQGEYVRLVGLLRDSCTLARFIAESREQGASACLRAGMMLRRLVPLSGSGEGEFLRAFCHRMNRDALEMEALMKTPGGIEGWRQRCAVAAGQVSARLKEKSAPTRRKFVADWNT